ncbi:hypothetical protein LIER_39626 [Lithospermum erythrorhizon]|uniref:HMA domain-containing protein n=1 Tax=Lithospermum erythrorhizon TaxID=34254 RepID=A0AAV3QLG9_LITER
MGEYNQNQNKQNNKKINGNIVLGVYIHCEGCANSVAKHLRCFEGVEGVEIDAKQHNVIVRGQKADPIKVTERLRKKTGKHVQLIYPTPKMDYTKEKKKEPVKLKVIEVVLKVYLHCEGCAKEVKFTLHKMPGVQTVDPDMSNNIVIVKGTMDPQKLVEFINKRSGRHAMILKLDDKKQNNSQNQQNYDHNKKNNQNQQNYDHNKQNNQNQQNYDHNKQNNQNKKKDINSGIYPKYPLDLVLAPQLFSDENPNACSIM